MKDEGDGVTEIEILNFLGKHDNIATMLNSYVVGQSVWIVLELCEAGDIIEYFNTQTITEEKLSEAFAGLLRALEYCHS